MQYNIKNQDTEDLDNPDLFERLTENEKSELLNWIYNNFEPIQSFTSQATSYSLKQKFSRINFYIYNGVFKGAMLEAGFKVKNFNDKNWIFNISKNSNYFKLK